MNRVIEYYTNLLEGLDCVISENGEISWFDASLNNSYPVKIASKSLILPTNANLRNPDIWTKSIAFHPLSEHIFKKESVVIKKFKDLILLQLMTRSCDMVYEFINILNSPDLHKKMGDQQAELLRVVTNPTASLSEKWTKICNKVTPDGDAKLFTLYIKNKGSYKGKEYPRVAITGFNIYDDSNKNSIFGIDVGVKNKDQILKIWNYIFKNPLNDKEEWNYGSSSPTMPNFDSIINVYKKFVLRFNELIDIYGNLFTLETSKNKIKVDWMEQTDDLEKLRNLIPALEGNSDGVPINTPEANVPGKQTEPNGPFTGPLPTAAIPVQVQAPAPVQVPQPVQVQPQQPAIPNMSGYLRPANSNNPLIPQQQITQPIIKTDPFSFNAPPPAPIGLGVGIGVGNNIGIGIGNPMGINNYGQPNVVNPLQPNIGIGGRVRDPSKPWT